MNKIVLKTLLIIPFLLLASCQTTKLPPLDVALSCKLLKTTQVKLRKEIVVQLLEEEKNKIKRNRAIQIELGC